MAAVAFGVYIFAPRVDAAGIVAGAQVAAALGTFALAVLAFYQVSEMRAARIAQESPQIIVEADYSSRSPLISAVVRNIGKGPAKNIRFAFSAPMYISWEPIVPGVPSTLDKGPPFKDGIPFLALGAEIPIAWDNLGELSRVFRERGLEGGITITSKYESLGGDYYETPWTINPVQAASIPEFGDWEG